MDLNEIWQQNKAWILGILAGFILFLIGNSLINKRFNVGRFGTDIRKARTELLKEHYGLKEKRLAGEKKEELEARLARIREKTHFRPREAFLFEGKSQGPELYYLQTENTVRSEIVGKMELANVEFLARDLGMPALPPTYREEKQKLLFGLDMVSDSLERLLQASDLAQAEDPDAHGLTTVEQVQIRGTSGRKSRFGSRRRSRMKLGGLAEFGERVQVHLRFRSDPMTLELFLESLVGTVEMRPLLLSDLSVVDVGENPGQPLLVNCDLLALLDKG